MAITIASYVYDLEIRIVFEKIKMSRRFRKRADRINKKCEVRWDLAKKCNRCEPSSQLST